MVAPEQWVRNNAYHVGDRTLSPQVPPDQGLAFSTPSTNPGLTFSAPTELSNLSQTSSGHRCYHPGCKSAANAKVFNTRSDLRKHARIHIPKDQRPYPCDMCAYRAYDTRDLDRHTRAHDGMSVVCHTCGTKVADRTDALLKHQRTKRCILSSPTTPSQSAGMSPASGIASEVQCLALGMESPSPSPRVDLTEPAVGLISGPLWTTVLKRGLS